MPTDFERDLSELLHTVTPEPPDYLASPSVAGLPGATDTGAEVIELATTRSGHAPRRRHRWPIVVAAASVAALAAGVVAITQIGTTGHPQTHHSTAVWPVTTTGTPTTTSKATTVPRCRTDQLVLSSTPFAAQGRAGTAGLIYRNIWGKQCALMLPAVAIGTKSTGGTPFPARGATIRIPGHGKVVVTAHIRVSGRCHTVNRGLRINVSQAPVSYSIYLQVAGCTLTPLGLTHRVVR